MKKANLVYYLVCMTGLIVGEYKLWGYEDPRKHPYALFLLDTKDPKEIKKTIYKLY